MGNKIISGHQLQFFKDKIKKELDTVRSDIGDLRYNLYISMVDGCMDYDQLKEMAELEMQIDTVHYVKQNINSQLNEKSVDIKDLRKVCYPPYELEEQELEENDVEAGMDDPETLTAMALLMHKRWQEEPIEEKNREYIPGERIGQDVEVELTEEEEINLLTNEAIQEEDELSEDYGDLIEDDNTIEVSDDSDYFGNTEEDEENGIGELDEESEDELDSSYYIENDEDDDTINNDNDEIVANKSLFIEDEIENSEENLDELDNDEIGIEVNDDYFLEDSDDDTGDNENGENTEDGEDSNNDDQIEIVGDADDLFIETDEDEDDQELNDSNDIEIINDDEFFVETDEEGTQANEDEEIAEDDDSYFSNENDEEYSSPTNEDEPLIENNFDDYFSDTDTGEVSTSNKMVKLKPATKRAINPYSVFKDEKTQGIFNLIHKSIKEANKLTQKAVEATSKNKISANSFSKLDIK